MSFTDDFLKGLDKRGVSINAPTQSNSTTTKKKKKKDTISTSGDFTSDFFNGLQKRNVQSLSEDFAPIRTVTTTKKKDEDERKWFNSGLFEDGYDFGDISKTILGSGTDFAENIGTSIMGMGEKAWDGLLMLGAAMNGQQMQQAAQNEMMFNAVTGKKTDGVLENYQSYQKQVEKETAEYVAKDLYDEEKIAKKIITQPVEKFASINVEDTSVFGEKSDALIQSGGQMVATAGLQAVGLPWFVTTGATAYGSQAEQALKEGATFNEANASALISAGAEILTEKLSGGIKFGGKTLDDVLLKPLTERITSKTLKTLTNLGLDAVGEGSEEVVSSIMSNLGTALYKEDKVSDILFSEEAVDEYIESFIGGSVLGGVSSGIRAVRNGVEEDYTENEQKVIDKEIENRIAELEQDGNKLTRKDKSKIREDVLSDLDKGAISIDTIESVLGGETYDNYKSTVEREDSLLKEFEELGNKTNATLKEQTRYKELADLVEEYKSNSQRSQLKTQLSDEVFNLAKGSRLAESYNERTRKSQYYETDLNQYDEKQRVIVQKAIDSKLLNNTNRTHDFVDMIAKLSAEKGVLFDFTNNEKLKESGYAVEGKIVNGFKNENGDIVLNMDSHKAHRSVVGHEITHILEGTELYTELQEMVKQYATTKGEYVDRMQSLRDLYTGVYEGKDFDEKIQRELTADIVGDYLFTDEKFINSLSTEKPNLFKRIYNEIKYLYKVATAGSKEARELEKVKRAFDKAYKVSGENTETKLSISDDIDSYFENDFDVDAYIDSLTQKEQAELLDGLYIERASNIEEVSKIEKAPKKARERYKGDTTNKGKIAKLTDERINRLFNEYGASNPEYAQAYITSIHPRDFLSLTLSDKSLELWDNAVKDGTHKEYFELDIEKLKGEAQTPFLIVDTQTGEVTGHEGRHRMRALLEAGVTDVPIAVIDYRTKYSKQKENSMHLTSQEFSEGPVNDNFSTDIRNLIPLNSVYKEEILSAYGGKGDIKYSLSDSDGKQLTKEQQDYFKDSKVRDENGNLKVMYHGSQETFTVFDKKKARSGGTYGKGFYFTDSTSHANTYGDTYDVYLNITNPLQNGTNNITKDQLRKFVEALAEDEDYGLENYGYGATIDSVTDSIYGKSDFGMLLDLNVSCVGDMVEAVELFNKVNGTNYDGIVAPTETVAFYPNQIKKVDNKAPTSNSDIRFSLSESVEETKDLVAVHNLSEEKLLKSLKLGGLPMPSIAIIKAKTGHKNFGDISIVFDKSTIDPKLSKYNKVFTSDAYTPTYPHIDYKIDSEVVEKGVDEVERLIKSKGYGKDDFGYLSSIDGDIFRYGNTEEVANKTALKVAYLIDKGIDFTPIYEEKAYSNFGRFDNEIIKYIAEVIGEERINELHNNTEGVMNALEEIRNLASERKAEKYKDNESLYKSLKEKPFYGENNFGFSQAHEIVEGAYNYFNNGAQRQIDEWQTANEIKDLIDNDDYKKWVDNLFNGFIEKEGIRNNVDLFTPSGNRRSFEALHWEHNLENVIKSMRTGLQQGKALFGSSIYGASQVELKSIADIKKDSDRLVDVDSEESKEAYREKRKDLELRFTELVSSIVRDNGNNVFMAMDDASAVLVESVLKCKTKTAMDNYIKRELEGWGNYSNTLADDLMDIVNELRALPTGYFEAKPQRAVMFDEVATVIIPDNTSIELKKMLGDNGIKYVEYESGNDQARVEALNSLDELKFSLSKENDIAPIKRGNVPLKDLAYQQTVSKMEKVQKDIAPIKEGVAKNTTTTWRNVLDNFKEPAIDENGEVNYTDEDWQNYNDTYTKADNLLVDEAIRDIESGMTSEQLLEKSKIAQKEIEEISKNDSISSFKQTITLGILQQQQSLYESASENPQKVLYELREEQFNKYNAEDQQDRLNSLTDEDVPELKDAPYYEDNDVVHLPQKRVDDIAKTVYEYVFPQHGEKKVLKDVIQKYATSEIPDKYALFDEIKKVYGEREYYEEDADYKAVQRDLAERSVKITDDIKAEFPEYRDFMRKHFKKIGFSKDGENVDQVYQTLSNDYPGLFPDDIWNPADQLKKMVEVADADTKKWEVFEVPDEDIQRAVDIIAEEVAKYTESQIQRLSEKENRAFYRMSPKYWEALMPPIADDVSGNTATTKDFAPVKAVKSGKQPKQNKGNMQDEKIAEILMKEPKIDKKSGLKRDWERFTSNFVDKATPIETIALKTGNRELDGKFNTIRYADTKAQTLIGEGADGVKSLNDIFGQIGSEADLEKFYKYLYHKHNVDRMSLESREADNLARLTEEMRKLKLDTLEEKQLYAISREKITDNTTEKRANIIETVREYLKSQGVKNKPVYGESVTAQISQEIVEKYEFENPDFVQVAEDIYNYNRHLRSELVDGGVISQETADLFEELYPHYVPIRRLNHKGIGVNVPLDTRKTGINAPIKRAQGGNSDILPLAQTMAQRTFQTYKAVAKNRFGVELKNTLGTTVEKADTDIDEIIESVDTHEELLKEGKHGANPTFTVFENGEKVTFEITEAIYDALKPTSEALSKTYNVLSTPTGIFKKLVTEYNPAFMLTNPIKDTQDVLINSQHPLKTYKNYPKAIAELFSKGRWYSEYMKNGGSDDTYFDKETNTFTEEKSGIKKVVGFPLEKISEANNFLERLPRLAEYIASRKMGRSIDVAMLDSARVTTNFRAGGDITKFLNRNGVTFLNPSVQGAVQQVRNVREAKANGLKGWALLATKVALAGLPGMLLNGLLWNDDEDYEELSEYVKQNYYIVWKNEDGKFIRVPKGRALAVIQNAFTQVQNALTGNDEVDIGSFLELVANNLAPNNPLENNILAPIMQVKNNKTWYGEDLVPSRLADLPAKEQFDESTDKFSKWLGGKINRSPVKINYLLNQYSGGVGDMILPMLTPEAESGKNSVLSNFTAPIRDKFTTDSVMNNQNVSNFYKISDELKVNANSSEATEEDKLKSKYFNAIRTEMSALYKEKREIQNNEYLNDSEKYNRVREVQEEINALSEEALNSYNSVAVEGKYAEIGDKQYRMNNDNEWQKISDEEIEKQNEVIGILGITKSQYWNNKKEYDMKALNPEKYKVLQEQGISVEDYKENYEEGFFKYTDDYSWASDNPEKYTLSKAITGDIAEYRKYTSDLSNIHEEDNTKATKTAYIFNLDIDYGAQCVLFKSIYNKDDTYNYEIIDYLNEREDISYSDMETILKELGFEVDSQGNISW